MSDKFKTKSWLAAVGGLLLASIGTNAMAFAEAETGESDGTSGNVVALANNVPGGETTITGDLYLHEFGVVGADSLGDEDAFAFYSDGTITANLSVVGSALGAPANPLLALFKQIGSVWTKQKSNVVNVNTDLAFSGTAGNYILLVSQFGNAARNGAGQALSPDTFDGTGVWVDMQNTTGALSAWSYSIAATGINTNASAVPVPAAVWLFGSGLMGLVGVARRRKA